MIQRRPFGLLSVASCFAVAGCFLQPAPTPQPQGNRDPQAGQVVVSGSNQPVNAPPPRVVAAPTQAGVPLQVQLVNATGRKICYLYLSVAGAEWGSDRLGADDTLEDGAVFAIDLDGSVPLWDLKAEDCGHDLITDIRDQPIASAGTWEIVATSTGGGGGYVASSSGGSSGNATNNGRAARAAAYYLGVSSGDAQYLARGDCGFIDNDDLEYFCRGDCGFINSDDVEYLCRGDCGFINDDDLEYFCRGDCGFINDDDLEYMCRGDCGFINNSTLADLCRG